MAAEIDYYQLAHWLHLLLSDWPLNTDKSKSWHQQQIGATLKTLWQRSFNKTQTHNLKLYLFDSRWLIKIRFGSDLVRCCWKEKENGCVSVAEVWTYLYCLLAFGNSDLLSAESSEIRRVWVSRMWDALSNKITSTVHRQEPLKEHQAATNGNVTVALLDLVCY